MRISDVSKLFFLITQWAEGNEGRMQGQNKDPLKSCPSLYFLKSGLASKVFTTSQ